MSVINYSKAIKETEKELLNREKEQTKAFVRDRIRFIRLLKSGRCSSQIQAGELTLAFLPAQVNGCGIDTGQEDSKLCLPIPTRGPRAD